MVEHNKKTSYLLACVLAKKANSQCTIDEFNDLVSMIEEDLVDDEVLFNTCLKKISSKDIEAIQKVSTI